MELAGTLGEIANDTLKEDFRSFRPEEARIILLESGPRILSSFPDDLAAAAERALMRLGVRVKTGAKVATIDPTGATLENGERIPSRTVLWGAGVKASPLGGLLSAELDRAGRVLVTQTCQLPGRPEVFVLGDMAALQGMPLPGVAPVAMQQGIERDNRVRERTVGLRVGLSIGEVSREDDDYFGDPVVEAARLCGRCEGSSSRRDLGSTL